MKRLFILLIFFQSCRQPIDDFKFNEIEPSLIIEALVTDSLTHHKVKLSYSASLNNETTPNYTIEKNASIVVQNLSTNKIDSFKFDKDTQKYISNLIAFKPNEPLKMIVSINGKSYEAYNMIPTSDSVSIDTIYSEFVQQAEEFNSYGQFYFSNKRYIFTGDSIYRVKISAYMGNQVNSYFRAELFRNSFQYKNSKQIFILNNELIGGTIERVQIPGYFLEKDTASVLFYKISKETFRYYESLRQLNDYEGGLFTPPPGKVFTNFNKNAIGFFEASSVIKEYIVIKKQ